MLSGHSSSSTVHLAYSYFTAVNQCSDNVECGLGCGPEVILAHMFVHPDKLGFFLFIRTQEVGRQNTRQLLGCVFHAGPLLLGLKEIVF